MFGDDRKHARQSNTREFILPAWRCRTVGPIRKISVALFIFRCRRAIRGRYLANGSLTILERSPLLMKKLSPRRAALRACPEEFDVLATADQRRQPAITVIRALLEQLALTGPTRISMSRPSATRKRISRSTENWRTFPLSILDTPVG